MKMLGLLTCLLLLMLVLPPAGHSAHHRHHYPVAHRTALGSSQLLLPLRVQRTPAVAEQRRLVRELHTPLPPNE